MKLKYILTNMIMIILISITLLTGYSKSLECPVFADSVTDEWTQVTTNEQLAEAFRYYCKSRDLTIEGSVADGLTTFTTKTFNGICNSLGIDVTALQAELKYRTDGNYGLRFLFSNTGITAYNRIFSQFLQDNDLSVGDTVNNKTLYSGKLFTDLDGNTCFTTHSTASSIVYLKTSNTTYGTPYKYTNGQIKNMVDSGRTSTGTFHLTTGISINPLIGVVNSGNTVNAYYVLRVGQASDYQGYLMGTVKGYDINFGMITILTLDSDPDYYYFTTITNYVGETGIYQNNNYVRFQIANPDQLKSTTIFITTNNNTINNNTYEGDTVINNEGDVINNDNDTNIYNPYPDGGGTITPPYNGGGDGTDGTINFPDFDFTLPEINWSLGDLSSKFPFCIPFDMIAFLTLLNAEPQAPHIQGQIPMTSHYTWNLDLDFAQFDTFAAIMRGLEFVGFMFFLISATINIVRG